MLPDLPLNLKIVYKHLGLNKRSPRVPKDANTDVDTEAEADRDIAIDPDSNLGEKRLRSNDGDEDKEGGANLGGDRVEDEGEGGPRPTKKARTI